MERRSRAEHENKHLNPRQVALVKNLVDGMTLTEAARRAGYSNKCPCQAGYQALQNLKLKMPDLLDHRLELSDVALIEKHLKPLLRAQTAKLFQQEGKVTDTRMVPDNDARLRALDIAFKLRGSYNAADTKPTEPAGVSVIVIDVPRPHRPITPIANPQLPLPENRS